MVSPALKPVGAKTGGECNASSPIRNTKVYRGYYSCDDGHCTCCSGSGETRVCVGCDAPNTCDNGHASVFYPPRRPWGGATSWHDGTRVEVLG
jgi:hypothetical protein